MRVPVRSHDQINSLVADVIAVWYFFGVVKRGVGWVVKGLPLKIAVDGFDPSSSRL